MREMIEIKKNRKPFIFPRSMYNMSNQNREYKERRRLFFERMIEHSEAQGYKVQVITCPFLNDDVLRFLKKLEVFEKASREADIGPVRRQDYGCRNSC